MRDRTALMANTFWGMIAGAAAALMVLAFRWLIEDGQQLFLPDGALGGYEALPGWAIFVLPVTGGLLLGWVFERLPVEARSVGVVHVLSHLRRPRAPKLPFRNALVQFFGGAFAIVCGHSVDREGPGVHLGAAAGNRIGRLASGDIHLYTLTACGAAASIAAAFNTPLAGVVFVIEVLRVRYRIDRFIPVIAASVVGAIIVRARYGDSPAFEVPELAMESLVELVLLGGLGLFIGLLAVLFIALTENVARQTVAWRPLFGFALAGVVTGVIGQFYPQVLGISYDTLEAILDHSFEAGLLIGLVFAKLVATAISIGLRVPGGLIGPSLFIGGAAGGFLGVLVQSWVGGDASSVAFYAAVGMIAMMGALLQAPLAALCALLELTADPNIILPGMTVVVTADLVVRQLLGKGSVFEHLRQLADRT